MLIQATMLIPTTFGHDRRRDYLTERCVQVFGGCTWLPSETSGAWADPHGTVHVDHCVRLMVALDGFGDLALVVALAREAARIYNERCVYVTALGVSELVWAETDPDFIDTEGEEK